MPLYGMTKEMFSASDYAAGTLTIAAIERIYRQAVAEGGFHAQDPQAVACMMHGLVEGAMRFWIQKPTAKRQKMAVDNLVEVAKRAFAP